MDAVAIGTGALAITTAFLAWRTSTMAGATREAVEVSRRMADATRESVEISRELVAMSQGQVEAALAQADASERTLHHSIQPLLADVPVGQRTIVKKVPIPGYANAIEIDDPGTVLHPAPARGVVGCSVPLRNIGAGIAVVTSGGIYTDPNERKSVKLSQTVLPPGEVMRVAASLSADESRFASLRDGMQGGNFVVEVGYSNLVGAEYVVTRLHVSDGRVRQVSFNRRGEEPFAMSGPADG